MLCFEFCVVCMMIVYVCDIVSNGGSSTEDCGSMDGGSMTGGNACSSVSINELTATDRHIRDCGGVAVVGEEDGGGAISGGGVSNVDSFNKNVEGSGSVSDNVNAKGDIGGSDKVVEEVCEGDPSNSRQCIGDVLRWFEGRNICTVGEGAVVVGHSKGPNDLDVNVFENSDVPNDVDLNGLQKNNVPNDLDVNDFQQDLD